MRWEEDLAEGTGPEARAPERGLGTCVVCATQHMRERLAERYLPYFTEESERCCGDGECGEPGEDSGFTIDRAALLSPRPVKDAV